MLTGTVGISLLLEGCAGFPPPPSFAVDTEDNRPTVQTIVREVRCELTRLVADKSMGGKFPYASILTDQNYGFAAELDLEVLDSGALTPSFTYPATKEFSLAAGLKYTRSRSQTFSTEIQINLAELKEDAKHAPKSVACPEHGANNLDYDLGIRNIVWMGLTAPSTNTTADLSAKGGEFGGSVSFVVTRGLDSSGPTWTLTHFTGPGKFGSLSRQDTDKIIFAFAVEKKKAEGKKKAGVAPVPTTGAPNASNYLNRLTIQNLQYKLDAIQNKLQ
jgi:hypothetical protein